MFVASLTPHLEIMLQNPEIIFNTLSSLIR